MIAHSARCERETATHGVSCTCIPPPTDAQIASITESRSAEPGTPRWYGFNDGVDAAWGVAYAAGLAAR